MNFPIHVDAPHDSVSSAGKYKEKITEPLHTKVDHEKKLRPMNGIMFAYAVQYLIYVTCLYMHVMFWKIIVLKIARCHMYCLYSIYSVHVHTPYNYIH